jgi:hypothetical protein
MSILVKATPDTLSAHLIEWNESNECNEWNESNECNEWNESNKKECGELVCQRIDINAYALRIHIDEAYQKLGWSRRLFKELFKSVTLDLDTLLVIDADASNGYWDYLGFIPNRYGYDYTGRRMFPTRGYEKIATVRRVKNRLGIR